MTDYYEDHPTPEELSRALGPRWAVCKNTNVNRAMYGNCITRKKFQDTAKQIVADRKERDKAA